MNNPVERKLVIWFGVMLIMRFANITLSYRATMIIVENERMVTHTYQVLDELEKTISTLTDAESGQRGYLLTGIDSYLEPYSNSVRISSRISLLVPLAPPITGTGCYGMCTQFQSGQRLTCNSL